MSEGQSFNRRAVRPVQCLREGWQLIKDDYWPFLGITFCGMLLGSMVPFGLLMGPMMCGIYLCLFRRAAGRHVALDMLFKGFDYFAQSLIATLLLMAPILLFVFLFFGVFFVGLFATVGTLSAQPQGQPADLTAVWIMVVLYLLFFVAMFLFSLLYGALFVFTYPLIVDRKLSGVEALRLSARAAWSNLGGILGLMLISGLLSLLGLPACYFGAIFVYPITLAMTEVAYRKVFPAEGSLLFEPPPSGWPEVGGRFDSAGQTGVQLAPDGPVSIAKPPDELGIQEHKPDHES